MGCANSDKYVPEKKAHPNIDDYCLSCFTDVLMRFKSLNIDGIHDPNTGLHFARIENMGLYGVGDDGVQAYIDGYYDYKATPKAIRGEVHQ